MTSETAPAEGAVRWRERRDSLVASVRTHPVLTVLMLAVLVHVCAVLFINVFAGGKLFEDDTTYITLASDKARGATAGWDAHTRLLYDTTSTFTAPLALLFKLFGTSALLGQLLAAAFAVTAAVLVTQVAREVLPALWAVAAGAVVALLPSQVLFSSLVLKDAAVWALLAALAVTIAWLGRAAGPRAVLLLLLLAAGLLFLLGHLRVHTLVAACWALAIASFFGVPRWRWRRAAAVCAVAMVIPWLLALGPAGVGLAGSAQANLDERRQANAVGAATALVPVAPAPSSGAVARNGFADNLRYLPHGLEAVLVDPVSWSSDSKVRFALAENVVWWPLLALAVVGLVASRRRLRALAFPALAAGGIAVMYALSEGNFGTAFRHRGEIVWAVALLAAVGAAHLATRRSSRSVEQ